MTSALDIVLVLLVLTNLMLLGAGQLGGCISLVAIQGILLGMLPPLALEDPVAVHVLLLALGSMGLKGLVFPRLLSRALREADVRREMEPFVGYGVSVLAGVLFLAFSVWLGSRLTLPRPVASSLLVPVAFFTILVGLFLVISRKKALSQALGYLVFENGIYTFGVGIAHHSPLLVELGVLLDVFVAVFVMGITIFHINREFDHIDADRLSTLKDWTA